jgi:hypothetical protein
MALGEFVGSGFDSRHLRLQLRDLVVEAPTGSGDAAG